MIGEMWHCGDDVCNCSRPRITQKRYPHNDGVYCIYEEVWSGSFHSWPEIDEEKEQWDELLSKCKELNVDNLDEIEKEYNERFKNNE